MLADTVPSICSLSHILEMPQGLWISAGSPASSKAEDFPQAVHATTVAEPRTHPEQPGLPTALSLFSALSKDLGFI